MISWTHIIIHHSLTEDGPTVSWPAIRRWHMGKHPDSPYKNKPMMDIGYHIGLEYIGLDYEVLMGRPLDITGAHTVGMNDKAIGICIVGNFDVQYPTNPMLLKLMHVLRVLCGIYKIPPERVMGHRDFAPKSCPGKNFNLEAIREGLRYGKIPDISRK